MLRTEQAALSEDHLALFRVFFYHTTRQLTRVVCLQTFLSARLQLHSKVLNSTRCNDRTRFAKKNRYDSFKASDTQDVALSISMFLLKVTFRCHLVRSTCLAHLSSGRPDGIHATRSEVLLQTKQLQSY